MKRFTAVVLVLGIAFVAILAASFGRLDPGGIVILIAIVAIAALGFAALRRTASISPERCGECDGVVSAHAPYCKHCGAALP